MGQALVLEEVDDVLRDQRPRARAVGVDVPRSGGAVITSNARAVLQDVVTFGRAAVDTVGDLSGDQIPAERFRELAALRTVLIVGEVAAQASEGSPARLTELPDLRRAIGLRNMLIHGYTKVRLEEVVRIVRTDLPRLIEDVENLSGETE